MLKISSINFLEKKNSQESYGSFNINEDGSLNICISDSHSGSTTLSKDAVRVLKQFLDMQSDD